MRVVFLSLFLLLCSCSGKSGNSSWLNRELPEQKLDFANKNSLLEHFQRGQYLVSSLGACGYCHALDLGGRVGQNISSDKEFGIGSWTLEEFIKVIKGGKKKDGKAISENAHKGMSWISDRDARAIGIYLLSSRPVSRPNVTSAKDMFSKVKIFDGADTVPGYVVAPKENANASYGRYITLNLASCASCHGAESDKILSGVKDQAPSLRKVGSNWSKEQIVQYLTTGKTIKGRQVSAAACPWGYYRYSNILDKQAIALFLKTLS